VAEGYVRGWSSGLASPPRAALDVVTTLATAGSSHPKSGEAALPRPIGIEAARRRRSRPRSHRRTKAQTAPRRTPPNCQGRWSSTAGVAAPRGWGRVPQPSAARPRERRGGGVGRPRRGRRRCAGRSPRAPPPTGRSNNSGRRESDRAAQPALATLGGTAAAAAAAAALSRSSSTFSPSTARASSHRASSHRASSHRALSACSSSRAPPGTSRRASKVP